MVDLPSGADSPTSDAICEAINFNREELVEKLLRECPDVNALNKSGETPLHVAAASGAVHFARSLLKSGARPDIPDQSGWLPIHVACSWKSKLYSQDAVREIVQLFLDWGIVRIDSPTTSGLTPLHIAAAGGSSEIVEFLIQSGANVYAKDGRHHTAIYYAVAHRREQIETILTNAGARPGEDDLCLAWYRARLYGELATLPKWLWITLGCVLLILLFSVMRAWGERRFVAGVAETFVAYLFLYGAPLFGITVGSCAGVLLARRIRSKAAGYTLGIVVGLGFWVASILVSMKVHGVNWRIDRLTADESYQE